MAATSKHGRVLNAGKAPAVDEAEIQEDLKRVEHELDMLKAAQADELAAANARAEAAELKNAEFEKMHRKWVLGDFSDLDANHPFEITIFTDEDRRRNHPVYVCINGEEFHIPRGIAWKVPRKVLDVLAETKVKGNQRLAMPNGTLQDVSILESRYHFQARPLYV